MVNNSSSHLGSYSSGDTSHFDASNPGLFARIAEDIHTKGYSINPGALPLSLGDCLLQRINTMGDNNFVHARVGREQLLMKNQFVRKNEICWISGESDAGRDWLQWTSELQLFLNRRLLLGLFSFRATFRIMQWATFTSAMWMRFVQLTSRTVTLLILTECYRWWFI